MLVRYFLSLVSGFHFFSWSYVVVSFFASGTEFPLPNSLLLSIESHDLI